MIPVFSLEIATPSAQWMERFPIGSQCSVAFARAEVDLIAIKIDICCKAHEMEGVRDALAQIGITFGDERVSHHFSQGSLETH